MTYWQHENPIECPRGHKMIWLGLLFWICPTCKKKTIWVQVADKTNQETA